MLKTITKNELKNCILSLTTLLGNSNESFYLNNNKKDAL